MIKKLIRILSSSLGGLSFGIDSKGNYGYYKYDETVGADTLVPFKNNNHYIIEGTVSGGGTIFYEQYFTATRTSKYMIVDETVLNTANLWRYSLAVNNKNDTANYKYLNHGANGHLFMDLNEGDILYVACTNHANASGTTHAKIHIIDWEY